MEEDKQRLHRLISSTGTFQKGIYHLYVLKNIKPYDAFDEALRKYQAIFLLGVTLTLLDFENVKINPKKDRFADHDPAAAITHSKIKNWNGFTESHTLYNTSQKFKELFQRIIDVRHNIIYRPLYLDKNSDWYWEDCRLKNLLKDIPQISEIENLYKDFFKGMKSWENNAEGEEKKYIPFFNLQTTQKFSNSNNVLLIAYANLLKPNEPQIEIQIKEYIIQLFGNRLFT